MPVKSNAGAFCAVFFSVSLFVAGRGDDEETATTPQVTHRSLSCDTDSECDGHPGATLTFADFCETYLAQLTIYAFDGVFTAPDRIEGSAAPTTHQIVIEATQAFWPGPSNSR